MVVKIQDVAKVAGVSPTTVSRVLNNRGYISEQTKEKVYQAMKELNYVPNDLARSLFNKRTNLVGLIVPTTSNPFFGELAFHIENICASLGFKVLICNSLNRKDKEEKYWDMLLRNQVDGVIVVTYNRGILNKRSQNLPIVAIDHYLSEKIPVVGSDNYDGGKKATLHLVEKGCQHIAHINGSKELKTPANLRREAYEDVMKEYGRDILTYEIKETFDPQDQQVVIAAMLNEHPEIDGIFASDDLLAASVMAECMVRNISIPNQMKIIGYDGTSAGRVLLPQLTTIQQPIAKIAQTAIDILLKEINADYQDFPIETFLPIQILEGSTT